MGVRNGERKRRKVMIVKLQNKFREG